jgi:transposase
VHKETVVACGRLALDDKITREVRTFETTTSGLLLLLAWLTELGCTNVAMEATGVYLYELSQPLFLFFRF